ncbi:putative AP2 protein [Hordeum vulgare]|nr:putative AP2 protein [Hordeum vulgare]
MPPRRRSASGYRGVHQHPNGGFYVEIRSGDLRLSLGTYNTAHEVARAFDATAWCLGRPRRQMNFQDVHTLQQALDVAPPRGARRTGVGGRHWRVRRPTSSMQAGDDWSDRN